MSEHVAAFVKRLRKERGLTQAELAQLAGVSRDTVVQLEKGGSEHGYSTVESVVMALGGRVDDISAARRAPAVSAATPEAVSLLQMFEELGSDDRAWLLETARRLYAMAAMRTAGQESAPGRRKKGPRKR